MAEVKVNGAGTKHKLEDAAEHGGPAKKVKADATVDEKSGEFKFPVFDLSKFLEAGADLSDELTEQCKEVAAALHDYGILIIKDPRVSMKDNDTFIDLLEKYFEQEEKAKLVDARPDVYYQVGVTPNGVEHARDHCKHVEKLADTEKPITECPPGVDPKWRFFWRMGERPAETQFAQLNAEPVIPAAFPEWSTVMNTWGGKMLSSVYTVAEMAARGFGLAPNTFTDMLKFGPHLLAPTGSDLAKFGKLGTVFAHFHYDLNFLTIHGRSRFPGLFVWTRQGHKVMVKVPENCLLLQAGKQFEWLTGGAVLAGFHEVVVVDATLAAMEKAKAEGRSLWRISSTLFSHSASDNLLAPVAHFATPEALQKYPPTLAGKQVQDELNAIKLGVNQIASM